MTITSFNVKDLRYELAHFLRYSDVLSVTVRGVTTATQNFTATAGQTVFTLTNTSVKCVRSLTVQTVAKYYLRDYSINYSMGVITLSTGATLNDVVSIQYDYGSSDKIYPDMPRDSLSLTSFPRVGISVVNATTKPLGLGGDSHISEFLISVYAWVPTNKDSGVAGGLGGTDDLNTLIHNIREAVQNFAKSFYTMPWIQASTISPIIAGTNNKIIQQSIDFTAKFKVEA